MKGPPAQAATIQYAQAVKRDLRPASQADRQLIRDALDGLAAGTANLDVKALTGSRPWLRLRAGDWRILYRPLTAAELPGEGKGKALSGYLVARIVNRRDLARAVTAL